MKKQKPNNSNGWEQSVEYWVYQASKGENIAECWQNIKKFISSELQREREKVLEEVIRILMNTKGDAITIVSLKEKFELLSKINKLK